MQLKTDRHNANRGTERGRRLLRESLAELGAGRSVLADKHGVIIAGNKTVEEAQALGLPTRVVETDGSELVVVVRGDLDLEADAKARKLAFADNRIAEIDLDWDVEAIRESVEAGVDLEGLWDVAELEMALAEEVPEPSRPTHRRSIVQSAESSWSALGKRSRTCAE